MAITTEDVKKFQELYKKEKGEDISYEESCECITNLVNLLRIVYKPITKEAYEKYNRK